MKIFKYIIFFGLLSFLIFFSCTFKPDSIKYYDIEGNITFLNSDGSDSDSSTIADVKLYKGELFCDSINSIKQNYSQVGPTFDPLIYSDYRNMNCVYEGLTDENGYFHLNNILSGKYLLVYSAYYKDHLFHENP